MVVKLIRLGKEKQTTQAKVERNKQTLMRIKTRRAIRISSTTTLRTQR